MASPDPRFVINLQGKPFTMLGGLLDLAHNSGLIGIETILDKDLSDPKEQFYVFQAIGRFRTENGEAIWSAHGDAAPSNSKMRGATLRHAETRAIARMLRMATNVAMCSIEELGPEGATDGETDGSGQGVAARVQPEQRPAAAAQHRDTRARPAAHASAAPAAGEVAQPEAGAQCCDHAGCGRELTRGEIASCEQAPMDGGYYCLNHASQHVQENGTVRRPANEMECHNPGCGKPLTKGQHDISKRSYGQPLCPACQKTYTRIG